MISTIVITTKNGETIAAHDYEDDFRAYDWNSISRFIAENKNIPIVQNGVYYYCIERNDLYFVAISATEVTTPLRVIETLSKLYELCKDFCGNVSEESLRKNAVLIQELLMEFMDLGQVQLCSADKLKPYIYSEPVTSRRKVHDIAYGGLLGFVKPLQTADSGYFSQITSQSTQTHGNDVFVDVIENLSIIVGKDDALVLSDLNGQLVMKCFVSGQPLVKLGLNEHLTIVENSDQDSANGTSVRLDTCNFHDSVNFEQFSRKRILVVPSSVGEITVMTYRMDNSPLALLPIHLRHCVISNPGSKDLDVELTLRCQAPISAKAFYVLGHLRVPKTTTSLMSGMIGISNQSIALDTATSMVKWRIENFGGQTEATAKLKLVGGNQCVGSVLQLGPLAIEFEISAFACSGLQVRFLELCFGGNSGSHSASHSEPVRNWIRYICHSNSYVFRLH